MEIVHMVAGLTGVALVHLSLRMHREAQTRARTARTQSTPTVHITRQAPSAYGSTA